MQNLFLAIKVRPIMILSPNSLTLSLPLRLTHLFQPTKSLTDSPPNQLLWLQKQQTTTFLSPYFNTKYDSVCLFFQVGLWDDAHLLRTREQVAVSAADICARLS